MLVPLSVQRAGAVRDQNMPFQEPTVEIYDKDAPKVDKMFRTGQQDGSGAAPRIVVGGAAPPPGGERVRGRP